MNAKFPVCRLVLTFSESTDVNLSSDNTSGEKLVRFIQWVSDVCIIMLISQNVCVCNPLHFMCTKVRSSKEDFFEAGSITRFSILVLRQQEPWLRELLFCMQWCKRKPLLNFTGPCLFRNKTSGYIYSFGSTLWGFMWPLAFWLPFAPKCPSSQFRWKCSIKYLIHVTFLISIQVLSSYIII